MKERYQVTGMTCSACSSNVEKAVNRLEGIDKASVNLLTETMEVNYDDAKLGSCEIIAAVERAGYGAALLPAGRRDTVGENADNPVLLQKSEANEGNNMKWRLGISIAFLLPLMYVAMFHMYNEWFGLPIPSFMHRFFHGNENAVTFALTQLLLLLPILYMNRKFFAVGYKTLLHFSPNMDSLIALGATASVAYGIFALYRIGYGLGHGNMALVEQYSKDLYFESAGMILTLITVGKYLESRSKSKTGEAIKKLMDLSPKMAVVLSEDGTETEVSVQSLKVGDIFLVKPGSLFPVDGTVLEGNSSVDEAAITGESVPVEKCPGDKVVSATMNKAGFLKCKADRVGEDTTLSQIIRLVEEAAARKAPIAQLADKVAGVFVPIVMGISLVTFVVWMLAGAGLEFAISTAIAVLVISCPCALGLATPVAIMVGTGVGAGHGILMKSGEALQQAGEIDTVVLDKTGTITAGKLKVMEVGVHVRDMSVDTLIRLAAALEKKSEHPLAEAVVEYASSQGLSIPGVRDFKAVFGRGVEGILDEDIAPTDMISKNAAALGAVSVTQLKSVEEAGGPAGERKTLSGEDKLTEAGIEQIMARKDAGAKAGNKYLVGNTAFMEENGISVPEEVLEGIARMADEGMTPLLVAEANRFLGVIGAADEVKSTSRAAISSLKKMGIHVVMLTGDNRRTAEAVRKRLDIEEVVAEVLPQDKEKKIRQLMAEGRTVAMIGDGINDAPALMAADVGMAIGAGTDVAMESADVVLMKSDLRDAVTAIKLSRAVIRNIKQNLFWAFFYNAIGIPLAAGLWYPIFEVKLSPMFGAAAMSLSSLFVVTNALRLKGFQSDFAKKSTGKHTKEATANSQLAEETKEKNATEETKETVGTKDIIETNATETGKEREDAKMKVIKIEGMMCGHCTGRVQKVLEAVEGVVSVTMSLEEKTATVVTEGEVTDEALSAVVTEAGYEVVEIVDK